MRGDLVFATSTPLTITIPGVFAKFGRPAPMVFEVRDLWPALPIAIGAIKWPVTKMLARALEKFAYRNSEHIVALSPGIADGIVATGYPRDRISVIPNAADLDLFEVSPTEVIEWRTMNPEFASFDLVTYTGTFGLINGVAYLIDVASAMRDIDSDIAFLLVGSGVESQIIQERATELGLLDHNVFIRPRVSKKDLPLILAASSVTTSVVTQIKENESNSANKFFDGLAAGRPVAINHGGWQRELLEYNAAGIFLDPNDPAAAATALKDLIRDEQRLKQMGASALSLAKREFARDDLAHAFQAVLERSLRASS